MQARDLELRQKRRLTQAQTAKEATLRAKEALEAAIEVHKDAVDNLRGKEKELAAGEAQLAVVRQQQCAGPGPQSELPVRHATSEEIRLAVVFCHVLEVLLGASEGTTRLQNLLAPVLLAVQAQQALRAPDRQQAHSSQSGAVQVQSHAPAAGTTQCQLEPPLLQPSPPTQLPPNLERTSGEPLGSEDRGLAEKEQLLRCSLAVGLPGWGGASASAPPGANEAPIKRARTAPV